MIVRMFAPVHYPLCNERAQFAACRGARTEIQQQELFQGQRLPLLLRISNLDDYVESNEGPKEWQLQPFKLPDFLQSGK